MDGEYPVLAVGVPLQGVAGGVDQRRDVEVGVTQIVDTSSSHAPSASVFSSRKTGASM